MTVGVVMDTLLLTGFKVVYKHADTFLSSALISLAMYAGYFRYVCEDCHVKESCGRGDIHLIRAFYLAHPGHRTRMNDFHQTGVALKDFLDHYDRDFRREERWQKTIKFLTFGRKGETIDDRRRKRSARL